MRWPWRSAGERLGLRKNCGQSVGLRAGGQPAAARQDQEPPRPGAKTTSCFASPSSAGGDRTKSTPAGRAITWPRTSKWPGLRSGGRREDLQQGTRREWNRVIGRLHPERVFQTEGANRSVGTSHAALVAAWSQRIAGGSAENTRPARTGVGSRNTLTRTPAEPAQRPPNWLSQAARRIRLRCPHAEHPSWHEVAKPLLPSQEKRTSRSSSASGRSNKHRLTKTKTHHAKGTDGPEIREGVRPYCEIPQGGPGRSTEMRTQFWALDGPVQ